MARTVRLGPVVVTACRAPAAVADLVGAVGRGEARRIAFANTHLVHHALRDPGYAARLRGFTVFNDGIGMALAARLAGQGRFPEDLNGTDLLPRFLAALPPRTRVFLVGAREAVSVRAAQALAVAFPHLEHVGRIDGYRCHGPAFPAVRAAIREARAQVVLVGMGNPLQETWIDALVPAPGPGPVCLGVGAFFDFWAQSPPRAPRPLRRLHLEWAYRLSREPRRLWRRYTVEAATVLGMALRQRLDPPPGPP